MAGASYSTRVHPRVHLAPQMLDARVQGSMGFGNKVGDIVMRGRVLWVGYEPTHCLLVGGLVGGALRGRGHERGVCVAAS